MKKRIATIILGILFLGTCFMSYRNYRIAVEADRFARLNSSALIEHAQYINAAINIGALPTVDQINAKLQAQK